MQHLLTVASIDKTGGLMNLRTVFRIGAIVFLINALGLLFSTGTFFEMANLTMSPSLLTVGQFMG